MTTRAFALLMTTTGNASSSGQRARLDGAAQVRVIRQRGEVVTCEIIASRDLRPGTVLDLDRCNVYQSAAELRHFEQLVRRYWGGVPFEAPRPELAPLTTSEGSDS